MKISPHVIHTADHRDLGGDGAGKQAFEGLVCFPAGWSYQGCKGIGVVDLMSTLWAWVNKMVTGRRNKIKKLGKSIGQTACNWGWGGGEKELKFTEPVLSVFHPSLPFRLHSNLQFVCFVDKSEILTTNEGMTIAIDYY